MTLDEIADAVAQAVREAIETAQPRPPKLMFNAEEASGITGLPVSFFEREAPAGHIPSRLIKPSGRASERGYRRFSLADLEAIVAAHEVKPTSGPMARAGAARLRRAA